MQLVANWMPSENVLSNVLLLRDPTYSQREDRDWPFRPWLLFEGFVPSTLSKS